MPAEDVSASGREPRPLGLRGSTNTSYFTEHENKLGVVVFLFSFFVYLLTLCPTVFTGDSGELITACYTLGLSHPPGYPLYCLLGKLFTFIPIGSIAFRVNLMSAFFASLAVTLVYFIIVKIINIISPQASLMNKFLPALSASLILAYSDNFWSQAVIAEVYTLFVFMVALTFFILIKWTQEKKNKLLYWFSFLYGATITAHQLGLFFVLGFFLMVLFYEPKIFTRPKTIFLMLCFFIFGFCLYLYLPIRASFDPPINWGKIHDLKGFSAYLLRKEYKDVKLNYGLIDVVNFYGVDIRRLKSLFGFLTKEFSPVWMVSGFGIIPLVFKARRYLLVLLTIFLMAVIRAWMPIPRTPLTMYIGKVYLLSGYIIVAIFLGLGFFYFIELLFKRRKKIFYYLIILIVCLLMTVPLTLNYLKNDQSQNTVAYDYGRNILDTLGKDAILLGHGDNALFILTYLTLVEKLRPDITIYDDVGGHIFKYTPFNLINLDPEKQDLIIRGLLKNTQRPLYIAFGHMLVYNTEYATDLVGIVYKVLREKEKIDPEIKEKYWLNYNIRNVFYGRLKNKDYLMQEIISMYHMALGTYLLSKNDSSGLWFYNKAAEISADNMNIQCELAINYELRGMYSQAIAAFKRAAEIEPDEAEVYYDLGVTYARVGMYEEAISSWQKILKLDPDFKNTKEYMETAKQLINSARKTVE